MYQNHLENLLKHRLLGLNPRVSASVNLGLGLRSYILNVFPGDDDGASPGKFENLHPEILAIGVFVSLGDSNM